jgi:hypothetical protein
MSRSSCRCDHNFPVMPVSAEPATGYIAVCLAETPGCCGLPRGLRNSHPQPGWLHALRSGLAADHTTYRGD